MRRFTAVLLALALIGCGAPAQRGGGGGNQAATPAPSSAPATPAKALDEVKVGWIAHLSGTFASQGEGVKRGVDMAVEKVNGSGGVKSLGGAKLSVEWGDGQSKTQNVVSQAERLASNPALPLIVGQVGTGETLAASQVTERKEVPYINALAAAPEIYARGFKHVWGIAARTVDYAYGMVDFYKSLLDAGYRIERIGLLYQDSEYGKAMEPRFVERLKSYALQDRLVQALSYPPQATDLTPVVSKLKAANPEMVFIVGYLADGLKLYKTFDQLDFHPILMGTGGAAGDPRLVKELGDRVEGLLAVDQWSIDRREVTQLNQDFKARYGTDMDVNAALGYQAVMLVKAVLEAAGRTDRTAIEQALRNLRLGPGPDLILPIAGIQFAPSGFNELSSSLVTQFQNRQKVTVWPAKRATGQVQIKK